jgi:hypothetical protein
LRRQFEPRTVPKISRATTPPASFVSIGCHLAASKIHTPLTITPHTVPPSRQSTAAAEVICPRALQANPKLPRTDYRSPCGPSTRQTRSQPAITLRGALPGCFAGCLRRSLGVLLCGEMHLERPIRFGSQSEYFHSFFSIGDPSSSQSGLANFQNGNALRGSSNSTGDCKQGKSG